MNSPVYAEDKVTLLGYLNDGKFEPIQATQPAPTGDELDELLDACCTTIENAFKAYGRLHPDLWMDDGQHSLVLTDGRNRLDMGRGHRGVRSWIVEGTLRSADELTPVLNRFLDEQKRLVRLRKVTPEWKFDNDALIVISSRFGLQAPKSFAELKAKREAERLERDRIERQRREQEQAAREAFKQSQGGKEQARAQAIRDLKEDTIRAAVDALATRIESDPMPSNMSELSGEEQDTLTRRARGYALDNAKEYRRIERLIRPVVEASNLSADAIVSIYNKAVQDWIELEETIDPKYLPPLEKTIGNYFRKAIMKDQEPSGKLEPSRIPPLLDGVERTLFDSTQKTIDFLAQRSIVGVHLFVRMQDHETFVVDVMPESLVEQYVEHVAAYEASMGDEDNG
jgi:hypothetical protein